jgi:dihydroxy-acid dehydratase
VTDFPQLRSSEWFAGDDEVAVIHRVAMRNAGLDIPPAADRPVIGIANSASDLNSCNLPLTALAESVRAGVLAAGGIPAVFPTISLGEDLMKPSAMLYRNLLAMEVEETLRSYPLDAVVVLGACDKTIPGAVMGAVSADLPMIVVVGGWRPVAQFHGRRLGTGTDLWRAWDDRRAGHLDDDQWAEFERCLACGVGTCNTMGTASSMAVVVEALGLTLPGASTIAAGHPDSAANAELAGRRIVELVRDDVRPSTVLTPASFGNAIKVLNAVGGSTNAVLHLAAIAGRLGFDLAPATIGELSRDVPVIADVEPSGQFLMADFHACGGVPAVLRQLGDRLDTAQSTVSGRTIAAIAADARAPDGEGLAIRSIDRPLRADGAFAVVHGSLAPDGALLKTSAADPRLFQHRGPALVFHGYDDLRRRIDDPELSATADTVLVLIGCGPVGVPGMPEWGMIPIPAKLAADGVTDMVRVTDARMSGTSFGTVFLHVAPEAAIGGPLALVRDGDQIDVDVATGRLDLLVAAEELNRRRAAWTAPTSPHLRGWPALYQAHVTQAPSGCDLDFLQAPTRQHRRFIPPVVGRS